MDLMGCPTIAPSRHMTEAHEKEIEILFLRVGGKGRFDTGTYTFASVPTESAESVANELLRIAEEAQDARQSAPT